MCNVSHEFENKFDTTTEEYFFLQKSLEKAEIVFIQGDEDIALILAKHVCECQHYEVTYSMINDILAGCIDFKPENRDIIFMIGNVNISRELIQAMRGQVGQDKIRWFFIGRSHIPNGVGPMAVVEIRPEHRCGISRKDGIGIEMLGPNCTGLTRLCLRYKRDDKI